MCVVWCETPTILYYQRPTTRYIDTDDYLFNKLKRDRKKTHLEDTISKEQRRLRFDREVHKRDQSAIRERINDIKEFWRTQSLKKTKIEKYLDELDIWTPDENVNSLKSFREWKQLGNEQQRIVDDIMEQLERSPHQWAINFEQLNNKGR
ncbi:hypothetical protein M9Y10_007251 [Tritrichomonas musculus]|uniref:Uncharacterized protein n=1 Tax=Tritrichomonas musculus TaxID=1915356 RepID=A0ABR2J2S2_9EUKA